MSTIYAYTSYGASAIWLLLMVYSARGLWRVLLGGYARSDLLSVLISAVAFNYVGYGAIRLLFWAPEKFTDAELLARSMLSVLSIVCAFFAATVLHQYRRREAFKL